jgi:BON domain-containing protein
MAYVLAQFSYPRRPSPIPTCSVHFIRTFSKYPDVGTEISVMTKNGIVYLKGETSTPLAKSHAEELAKAVPGVQKVVDDIGTEK